MRLNFNYILPGVTMRLRHVNYHGLVNRQIGVWLDNLAEMKVIGSQIGLPLAGRNSRAGNHISFWPTEFNNPTPLWPIDVAIAAMVSSKLYITRIFSLQEVQRTLVLVIAPE